jgi:hypothetical protein
MTNTLNTHLMARKISEKMMQRTGNYDPELSPKFQKARFEEADDPDDLHPHFAGLNQITKENVGFKPAIPPVFDNFPLDMNDNFMATPSNGLPTSKSKDPFPTQPRGNSAGVSQHTRSAIERMASPQMGPQKTTEVPALYNKSNNYLEVIRSLKNKHGQILSNNFTGSTRAEGQSKKKVINVDLRKSQAQFQKSVADPEVHIPRSFDPRQPDYVVNNIGSSNHLRTMEKNDLMLARDYGDRRYINDDHVRDLATPSPNGKRKVEVRIDRLSQKVLSKF